MPRVKGTRTIICEDCGMEYETIGWSTKRCPPCSAAHNREMQRKRNHERTAERRSSKENELYFYDSPDQIKRCLNCRLPSCKNCLRYGGAGRE